MLLRLWLASFWLPSGWGKLTNPAWMETGVALKGFWERAVTIPANGRSSIAFDLYRGFIQFLLDIEAWTWFAKLIVIGEIVVGVALILGLLTGIAAFTGGFMNWNFIMAGTASSNGLLFFLSILIILAWKVAGWWGLDRWALPYIGTPWADKVLEEEPKGEKLLYET